MGGRQSSPMAEKVGICWQILLVPECVGLVAQPVFITGLRPLWRPWRFDSPAFRPSVSREGDDRPAAAFYDSLAARFHLRGLGPDGSLAGGGVGTSDSRGGGRESHVGLDCSAGIGAQAIGLDLRGHEATLRT